MSKGHKIGQYPDSNSGHPDYQASTVPLFYADLLLFSSFGAHVHKITNGRGFYTALCVMCLRQANPFLGAFEGLGPKSLVF